MEIAVRTPEGLVRLPAFLRGDRRTRCDESGPPACERHAIRTGRRRSPDRSAPVFERLKWAFAAGVGRRDEERAALSVGAARNLHRRRALRLSPHPAQPGAVGGHRSNVDGGHRHQRQRLHRGEWPGAASARLQGCGQLRSRDSDLALTRQAAAGLLCRICCLA